MPPEGVVGAVPLGGGAQGRLVEPDEAQHALVGVGEALRAAVVLQEEEARGVFRRAPLPCPALSLEPAFPLEDERRVRRVAERAPWRGHARPEERHWTPPLVLARGVLGEPEGQAHVCPALYGLLHRDTHVAHAQEVLHEVVEARRLAARRVEAERRGLDAALVGEEGPAAVGEPVEALRHVGDGEGRDELEAR